MRLARRRVELDPFSEEAGRELMQGLADAGDRAGALAAYERLRDRLARELGVAPAGATRQLASDLREHRGVIAAGLPARLAGRAGGAFVGRERELARLRQRLAEAQQGALRTVLVAGEPGIGKTRLATAVAHDAGTAVLYGSCDEEPLAPYQPWAEAVSQVVASPGGEEFAALAGDEVRRLVPALGVASASAGTDAQGERLRLYDGVLRLLASIGPLTLVLDDLHWADAGTLSLLRHVVRAAPPAPILIVAAFRHTEPAPALWKVVADLYGEPGVDRIQLRGLGDTEVGLFVRILSGGAPPREVTDALSERTGGSPFFIEEIVRHAGVAGNLAEGAALPLSVRDVIARRVGRLGENAADVLGTAATIGMHFQLEPLASVSARDADAVADLLDAASAAGLLTESVDDPGSFAFAHALVRDAMLAGLGTTRRARLHAAVGRALATAPGADAAAVARHLGAAAGLGFAAETVEWSERAAREACAMLGYDEAVAHLERALAAAGPAGLDARRRGQLQLQLGDALSRSGLADRARTVFGEAAQLARDARDPELLARAAVGRGGLGVALVDVDESLVALLEEALGELGDRAPALRALLLSRLAIELYYTGELGRARARDLTAEALELARESADVGAVAKALAARHVALWRPDLLEDRLAIATELVELGGEAALEGRHWRFVDLMEAGDAPAAYSELAEYERLSAQLRIPAWAWYVPLWRASLAAHQGRWREAEQLIEQAHTAGRRAQDANADLFHLIQTSNIPIERHRFDELEVTDEILARAETPVASAAWRSGFAWLLAERGEPDRGRVILLDEASDGFARVPWDANRLGCLIEYGEAALTLRERKIAGVVEHALAPFAASHATAARMALTYGPVRQLLGRLAAFRGDLDAAVDHLDRAIADLTAFGAEPRLVQTRVALADVLRRRGAPGDAERTDALLLTARARAGALGTPELLTLTELQPAPASGK